jgi:hypothetical protein
MGEIQNCIWGRRISPSSSNSSIRQVAVMGASRMYCCNVVAALSQTGSMESPRPLLGFGTARSQELEF